MRTLQATTKSPYGEIYRQTGISEANNWRKEHPRLAPSQVLWRRLETENGQLKKIATDLSRKNEELRRKLAVQFNSGIKDAAD